jgi:hypothetical protein
MLTRYPYYGAAEVGPFREMRVGADDATTNGAVTWVAAALGLVGEDESYPSHFDKPLAVVVGRFQEERGLPVTTVVDEATYRALGYTGKVLAKDAKVGGGEYTITLRERFASWKRDPMFWVASTATVALLAYVSHQTYVHLKSAND